MPTSRSGRQAAGESIHEQEWKGRRNWISRFLQSRWFPLLGLTALVLLFLLLLFVFYRFVIYRPQVPAFVQRASREISLAFPTQRLDVRGYQELGRLRSRDNRSPEVVC